MFQYFVNAFRFGIKVNTPLFSVRYYRSLAAAALLVAFAGTAGAADNRYQKETDNALSSADVAAALAVVDEVHSSDDPKDAYDHLTPEDKLAFDNATTPVETVETADDPVPVSPSDLNRSELAGSRCWYIHIRGSARARAGNTLYTYWQNTAICSNGSRVTAVWVDNAYGETSTPGWRMDPEVPKTWTKNVGWEGRGVARYYFILGIGGWDVQHPVTCLQGRLNRDNVHYAHSRSCNIG